jgi:hypothetical protein
MTAAEINTMAQKLFGNDKHNSNNIDGNDDDDDDVGTTILD